MKFIAAICLLAITACAPSASDEKNQGWHILRWVEKPSSRGVSQKADPKDRTQFDFVTSSDEAEPEAFEARKATLREGDLVAYWMKKGEARSAIFKGHFNSIGYRLLSYGHLAIVVKDPQNKGKLRLFSSQSFKGVNIREDIDTLKDHSWDSYRLDQWQRVDKNRLYEFVEVAQSKAGHWAGYDFSGMFALWNSNLKPSHSHKIGHDYICSTVVVATLYYSGLELDAVQREGLLDLVSPKQVVTSKGRIIALPDVKLEVK
ncbi:MAG: hypothetical protein ACK5JP_00860 [Akkermansiaceae bacterium]|jgi:hypothetical protein